MTSLGRHTLTQINRAARWCWFSISARALIAVMRNVAYWPKRT